MASNFLEHYHHDESISLSQMMNEIVALNKNYQQLSKQVEQQERNKANDDLKSTFEFNGLNLITL